MRLIILLAFISFTVGIAGTSAFADCSNAQTTADMVECGNKEYAHADKQLNQSYQQLMKSLDAEGKRLLVTAESSWIKYRDNQCRFERDFARGGTMAPLLSNGCMTQMTIDRNKILQDQINLYKQR